MSDSKNSKKTKDIPGSDPGGQQTTNDPLDDIWGTDSLKKGYSYEGRVIGTSWSKSKFGSRDQLEVRIQPNSDGRMRTAYYRVSSQKDSVWGIWQKALENCGFHGEQAIECSEDLEGLKFKFEVKDIEFGTDSEGNPIVAKNVTIPVKWLHGQDREKTEIIENFGEDIDLEALILNIAGAEPTPIGEVYTSLESKASKKDILGAIKTLEAKGKVVFEDGIVLGV